MFWKTIHTQYPLNINERTETKCDRRIFYLCFLVCFIFGNWSCKNEGAAATRSFTAVYDPSVPTFYIVYMIYVVLEMMRVLVVGYVSLKVAFIQKFKHQCRKLQIPRKCVYRVTTIICITLSTLGGGVHLRVLFFWCFNFFASFSETEVT